MEREAIRDLIDRYIRLTHDVWKNSENLIREEIGDDLTNDQQYILRYIYKKQDQKCTTTELAEAFFVRKSAITAIINRLVDKNYIMRTPDQNDRRYIYLTLTTEGQELYEKTEAKIFKLVESFITKFNQDEIENFMNTYEKLARYIKETE